MRCGDRQAPGRNPERQLSGDGNGPGTAAQGRGQERHGGKTAHGAVAAVEAAGALAAPGARDTQVIPATAEICEV